MPADAMKPARLETHSQMYLRAEQSSSVALVTPSSANTYHQVILTLLVIRMLLE